MVELYEYVNLKNYNLLEMCSPFGQNILELKYRVIFPG